MNSFEERRRAYYHSMGREAPQNMDNEMRMRVFEELEIQILRRPLGAVAPNTLLAYEMSKVATTLEFILIELQAQRLR